MAAVVASSSSSTSSPSLERRARSRSFGAVTPTFSTDLAKLKALTSASASSSSGSIVHSFQEAIAIAKTLDVLGVNSPLRSKLILNGEEDWINFIKNSGAVVDTTTSGASGSGVDGTTCGGGGVDGAEEVETISIHLEKFLRHCFDIAYKLPPNYSQSTTSTAARAHVRSSSSFAALGVFATATGTGGGENSSQV